MASAPAPTPRWSGRRRSFAGPVVLILLGVLFLLGNMHVLSPRMLAYGFARFWPALLILWGVIKLAEYFMAQRGGYATPGLGVGGVLLLVFLVIFGIAASTASRLDWSQFNGNVDWNDDDFNSIFGNSYQFSDTLEQPFTPGDTLRIEAAHGDITVLTWDESNIKVVVSKRVLADNQAEADKVNLASKPTLSSDGHEITLNSNTSATTTRGIFQAPAVHSDLEIYLPRKAALDLATSHGDLKISGAEGDVKIDHSHGDVDLESVNGNAMVTLNHGDLTAHSIGGSLTVNGHAGDVNASDVKGEVSLSGDFFNDVNLSNVGGNVRFESVRTDLQTGPVAGELRLDPDNLSVRGLNGGFTVHTRSKDIRIENVNGAITVDNSNGEVEVRPGAQMGDISITDRNGAIQLFVPPGQGFQLQATTREGQINSDFSEFNVRTESSTAVASGSIGSGSKRIQLNNQHADIDIRKGVAEAAIPAPPPAIPQPPQPAPRHAPHPAPAPAPPAPVDSHTY